MRTAKRMPALVAMTAMLLFSTSSGVAHAATGGTLTFAAEMNTTYMGEAVIFQAAHGWFSFWSNTCAGATAGKVTTAGVCSISGSGYITGNCTFWTAMVWGTIYLPSGDDPSVDFELSLMTAGYKLVGSGSATWAGQTGPVLVEGTTAPAPTGPHYSCWNGLQHTFLALASVTWGTV